MTVTNNLYAGGTVKLADLLEAKKKLETLGKQPWVLIAPNGDTWVETDTRKLMTVLMRNYDFSELELRIATSGESLYGAPAKPT